jgi:hypothetical protein
MKINGFPFGSFSWYNSFACSICTRNMCRLPCTEDIHFQSINRIKQLTLSCSVSPLSLLFWTWVYHPQNLLTLLWMIPQRWERENWYYALTQKSCAHDNNHEFAFNRYYEFWSVPWIGSKLISRHAFTNILCSWGMKFLVLFLLGFRGSIMFSNLFNMCFNLKVIKR